MTRLALVLLLLAAPVGAAEVRFSRDVRPLLADACFACHGPDAKKRKADFRLDTEAGAFAALTSGGKAFVPGKPADSEALTRLHAKDRGRMPPASARQLTAAEIDTIRRWIEQGAKWQTHWAFVAPKRPAVPATVEARNPVDAFVLGRLKKDGLAFSPEADRAALLRRVTLDLTGLPPTVAEADSFLADERPDAYERVVERLLASPRLGERLAVRWLDAARYADTSGYQSDGERIMWRWRDQLIESLNQNQPFDRFTLEQLAGDLLPDATLGAGHRVRLQPQPPRQRRGRHHPRRVRRRVRRRPRRDDLDGVAGPDDGLRPLPRPQVRPADDEGVLPPLRVLQQRPRARQGGEVRQLAAADPVADATAEGGAGGAGGPHRGGAEAGAAVGAGFTGGDARKRDPHVQRLRRRPQSTISRPSSPSTGRPDRETWPSFETGSPSSRRARSTYRPCSTGSFSSKRPKQGNFGYLDRFSLAAWIYPEKLTGTILSRMTDAPEADGYSVRLHEGRVQVNLVKRWLDDAIRVETEEVLKPNAWRHIVAVYDGSRTAAGVRVYLDGKPVKMRVLLDDLNQTFESKEPLRIGAGNGPLDRFRGRINEVVVFTRDLDDEEAAIAAVPEDDFRLGGIPSEKLTPGAGGEEAAILHPPGLLRKVHRRPQ